MTTKQMAVTFVLACSSLVVNAVETKGIEDSFDRLAELRQIADSAVSLDQDQALAMVKLGGQQIAKLIQDVNEARNELSADVAKEKVKIRNSLLECKNDEDCVTKVEHSLRELNASEQLSNQFLSKVSSGISEAEAYLARSIALAVGFDAFSKTLKDLEALGRIEFLSIAQGDAKRADPRDCSYTGYPMRFYGGILLAELCQMNDYRAKLFTVKLIHKRTSEFVRLEIRLGSHLMKLDEVGPLLNVKKTFGRGTNDKMINGIVASQIMNTLIDGMTLNYNLNTYNDSGWFGTSFNGEGPMKTDHQYTYGLFFVDSVRWDGSAL